MAEQDLGRIGFADRVLAFGRACWRSLAASRFAPLREPQDDYVQIPASAFEGLDDGNVAKVHMPCSVCGNKDTFAVSMASALMRPHVVNENTFLAPGFAWGYVVCEPCEAKAALTKAGAA